MKYNSFSKYFDQIAPRLGVRKISFRKIFDYLDKLPDPIIIVETGCLRIKDNFEGDGQSTLLFDYYTQFRGKGQKYIQLILILRQQKIVQKWCLKM